MKYDPQTVAAAFQRLFRTYPQFQADGAEDALRVYFEAVDPYETADIEAAVRNFLSGSAPGHNPAFAPSAPQVGAETRRVMSQRLEAEARSRAARPALPPPDIEKTPEQRARAKALVEQTVANLTGLTEPEHMASADNRKSILERANARFDSERGYGVGDPDGDRDVA